VAFLHGLASGLVFEVSFCNKFANVAQALTLLLRCTNVSFAQNCLKFIHFLYFSTLTLLILEIAKQAKLG